MTIWMFVTFPADRTSIGNGLCPIAQAKTAREEKMAQVRRAIEASESHAVSGSFGPLAAIVPEHQP